MVILSKARVDLSRYSRGSSGFTLVADASVVKLAKDEPSADNAAPRIRLVIEHGDNDSVAPLVDRVVDGEMNVTFNNLRQVTWLDNASTSLPSEMICWTLQFSEDNAVAVEFDNFDQFCKALAAARYDAAAAQFAAAQSSESSLSDEMSKLSVNAASKGSANAASDRIKTFSDLSDEEQSYIVACMTRKIPTKNADDAQTNAEDKLSEEEDSDDAQVPLAAGSSSVKQEAFRTPTRTDAGAACASVERDQSNPPNHMLLVSNAEIRAERHVYVARDNLVDVFTPDLQFLQTLNLGARPTMAMLHKYNAKLLFTTVGGLVHQCNLDRNGRVDDLTVPDDVVNIWPMTKYRSRKVTTEFIGLSGQRIFIVDPAQEGPDHLDRRSVQQYRTLTDFCVGAATGNGNFAVGSLSGDIRLYSEIGQIAKTRYTDLFHRVLGIDVTANGDHVVVTFPRHLILLRTVHPEIENTTLFQTKCSPDRRREVIMLSLLPEHMVELGNDAQFTRAKFFTSVNGESEADRITASYGRDVISWRLKHILNDGPDSYKFMRFNDTVVAAEFNHDDRRNIVVVLPYYATIVRAADLRNPTSRAIRQG